MDSRQTLNFILILISASMVMAGLYLNFNNHENFIALILISAGASSLIPHYYFSSKAKQLHTVNSSSHTAQSFQDTFEKAAIGLAHVDLQGKFIRVNSNLCQFLGYPEQELLETTFQSLSLPDDLEESFRWIRAVLAGEEVEDFSKIKRYYHKDGRLVWAKLTTTLVKNELNEPDYFVSSIQDISDLKNTEMLLRQSEEKFKTIIEAVSDEVVIWMSTLGMQEMLYVNQGFEKQWGRSVDTLYENPKSFLDIIHPDDKDAVEQIFTLSPDSNWNIDFRIIRDDGEIRHIHNVGFGILENGEPLYLVGSAVDRTDIMNRQQQLDESIIKLEAAYKSLEQLSQKDGLTGVFNRTTFLEHLSDAHERYKRYKTPATLIFIDLNQFKAINDNHGHITGDNTLIALANKLSDNIRQTDVLGRYGGDEFVVLLNNSSIEHAQEFFNRVGNSIQVDCNLSGKPLRIGISYGAYEIDPTVETLQQWISHADISMYKDKGTHSS
ncbi:diguanylate cyclase [Neptuniibacter marinus]|uniref:diguanylate cyclase n=1 Tax=Neptuniibacter marinus TaxID=1806670 RepID=UPI0009ED41E2|nr:diguanylate cyclase [Neptuniibacter marinus]